MMKHRISYFKQMSTTRRYHRKSIDNVKNYHIHKPYQGTQEYKIKKLITDDKIHIYKPMLHQFII